MKKQGIIIVVLITLLVVAVGYIIFTKIEQKRDAELFEAMQEAAASGYQQAILEIMDAAQKCEQVPLYAGNETVNLISVECLQRA